MYNRIDRNMKNVNNSPTIFSIFLDVFLRSPRNKPNLGGGGLYSRVYINASFFQNFSLMK